jgi:hypothetical protein
MESVALVPVDVGSEPLAGKLERFAQMLALRLPPDAAAREAQYPASGEPVTFAANARKRARLASVRSRVKWLARQEEEVLAVKRERLEERLWAWHESDIGAFYHMVDEIVFDADGMPILGADGEPKTRTVERLKLFSEMPPEQRLLVKSLRYTERGKPNLELYGADDANRELRKLNGLDVQRTAGEANFDRMSDAQIFHELARQASELGVNVTLSIDGGA